MDKIKTFFHTLRKEHKFLFSALILSFILAVIPCLDCIITLYEDKYQGGIFLIPFLVILLINILAVYIYRFIPKLTNVLTFLINTFIIIFIQLCLGIFVWGFMLLCNDTYMADKPEFYEKVIQYYPEEKIVHFPKHIPQNATNIEMYADMFSFQGGQSIILKFKINKDYIEKELKKYKFKSKENSNHYGFGVITDNGRIKIDDYDFYVIDGTMERFGKTYGIAVNGKLDGIIYYYSNPD